MQEIRFRAWDNENNRYFEDTDEAYRGNIEQLYLGLRGSLFIRTMDSFKHESTFPGRFVIELYTGLKDKKGREIYEGDVVRYNDDTRVTVEWIDDRGRWSPFSDRDDFPPFPYAEESEIIGNIHENPDLLSEAKVK